MLADRHRQSIQPAPVLGARMFAGVGPHPQWYRRGRRSCPTKLLAGGEWRVRIESRK